jgi:hypothetical protein
MRAYRYRAATTAEETPTKTFEETVPIRCSAFARRALALLQENTVYIGPAWMTGGCQIGMGSRMLLTD